MAEPANTAADGVERMDLGNDEVVDHGSSIANEEGGAKSDDDPMEMDDPDGEVKKHDAENPKPASSKDDNDNNNNNNDAEGEKNNIQDKDDGDDDGNDDADIDDDVSTTSSDNSDVAVDPGRADELLLEAARLKEEGNTHFKSGSMDKAARSYRRGCSKLKGLNKNNSGDEQVRAVLVALQSNLSMVFFKQSKFKLSCTAASNALKVDKTNVKALYRRALAYRKTGDLDLARSDLKNAIAYDPANTACKKELLAVKRELDSIKQSQKTALARAFSNKNASSFLYDDKVSAEKRKEEEERRKKLEQEELLKKRKAEWEDECVHRMAKNEPAITFDDWDKERKEKEKLEHERKREEEKRKKQERKKAREAERAARKAAGNGKADDNSNNDDDELTEQELATMRGYKKTSDGRTTSYFTREISDDAKRAIGDIAPKRLDEAGNAATSAASSSGVASSRSISPMGDAAAVASSSRPSAWNQAGTWEEKDTTSWCISQLRTTLGETSVTTTSMDADIIAVEDLTGDASVAIAGTKKRYIFDFHAKLKYEIKDLEQDKVVAGGVVRLPDICSGSHDELEVVFGAWKTRPAPNAEARALEARKALVDELRTNVQRWVQQFNEMY